MKIKKYYLTLLELLIAMSLAIALIVSTFSYYSYVSLLDQESSKLENEIFQKSLLQGRLTTIFSTSSKMPEKSYRKKALFFTLPEEFRLTKGPSLIFTYDSDSTTKGFTKSVLARLFVDSKNRLCLAVWPFNRTSEDSVNPPVHIEVLSEKVARIEFEFLTAPSEKTSVFNELEKGRWLRDWQAAYEESPAAVKLTLFYENGQAIPFAFAIPYHRHDKE